MNIAIGVDSGGALGNIFVSLLCLGLLLSTIIPLGSIISTAVHSVPCSVRCAVRPSSTSNRLLSFSMPSGHEPFTLNKNSSLRDIFTANRLSIHDLNGKKPEVLEYSARGQAPHTLWIGCSDSRVNECAALGCVPGEVFTVRNIGNVVTPGDLSVWSAIDFAINTLKVKRVVVAGHTDCGGCWGALGNKKTDGPLDNWLLPIREVRLQHFEELKGLRGDYERNIKLSEWNVIHSVEQVRKHPSFIKAAGSVEVYGLLYDVRTGYLSEVQGSNIKDATVDEVFKIQ